MFRKWIGKIHLAGYIAFIVNAIITCVYYNVIKQDHEGPMELWSILLMAIPIAILCISSIIIKVRKVKLEDSFENNKIADGIVNAFTVLAMILLFPILLVFGIVGAIISGLSAPQRKTFSALIEKGFRYQHRNKKYILQKENVKIEIFNNLEEYYISFDGGETFAKVEECHLGTPHDREELKSYLYEYQSAHPVAKQRGEADPPLRQFVDFLNTHLS